MSAPITLLVVCLNVGAYLLQVATGDALIYQFALWPLGLQFRIWQIVTYAFLHGNLTHILFNMFGLVMFGSDVERRLGAARYAIYYLVCVVAAAFAQLAMSSMTNADYPTVGASGGIFGLLIAFAMYFPQRIIVPLFPPIPMRARTFAIVYGGLELVLGVTGSQAGVAHFAHLGGMLGGYLLIGIWRLRGGGGAP
jgi:membrane associated rhomboid family serine protease